VDVLGWYYCIICVALRVWRPPPQSALSSETDNPLSTAIARIEAPASTVTIRIRDAFKNEDGAFDLPSILVGVVVVGILTAGVLASIFGVIPFAQDKGAQQDLGAVVTAEGTYKAQATPIAYGSLSDPQNAASPSGAILSSGVKVGIVKSADNAHFAAASQSGSGKTYVVTDANTTPVDISTITATTDMTAAVAAIPAG